MAFEEITNMAWVIILALIILISMIGVFAFLRPNVQGGWLTGIANTLKWFVTPP